MFTLLRFVLSLFGVRPADGTAGCVVTPHFKQVFKGGVTTVVIAVIIVLVVRGHAVEVFAAVAAAWLVDVLDVLLRRPACGSTSRTARTEGW